MQHALGTRPVNIDISAKRLLRLSIPRSYIGTLSIEPEPGYLDIAPALSKAYGTQTASAAEIRAFVGDLSESNGEYQWVGAGQCSLVLTQLI